MAHPVLDAPKTIRRGLCMVKVGEPMSAEALATAGERYKVRLSIYGAIPTMRQVLLPKRVKGQRHL